MVSVCAGTKKDDVPVLELLHVSTMEISEKCHTAVLGRPPLVRNIPIRWSSL